MTEAITRVVTAAAVFGVLDFVWLGLVMSGFYRTQLAPIARTADGALAPLWLPAVLVYVLLAVGIAEFVVLRAATLREAVGLGALFGVIVYGVYDLTNYATLTSWPLAVTLVDIAWGAFICGTTAAVTFTVVR